MAAVLTAALSVGAAAVQQEPARPSGREARTGRDRARPRDGQGRSEPRNRADDQDAPLEERRQGRAMERPRHGSRGSPGCFAGSTSRRACSCGARRWRWLLCWSSTSSARCAGTVCRAERNRSSHRLTCGIWTSGRRAFPTTSASQPERCGIAASTGRRWRCSTAACCPGSPTFTAFPFAIRAPKATALRWRRATSHKKDASTRRVSYGCGSGSCTPASDTQPATVLRPVR